MKVAITGADRPLGALLCRRLAAARAVIPIGSAATCGQDLGQAGDYRRVDLRVPANARQALCQADGLVHAQVHDLPPGDGPDAEQELLDAAARGTFVLVNAARECGIGRVVLVSQLALLEDYPEDWVVDETWAPRPRPEGASLAPYLAELVCREIARAGRIEAVCLRLGRLDAADGTRGGDAVAAVELALTEDLRDSGYPWKLVHVASGGRFSR